VVQVILAKNKITPDEKRILRGFRYFFIYCLFVCLFIYFKCSLFYYLYLFIY